jgi:hypothetical protein
VWLLRKLDSLVGTLLAATMGLAGSQLLEFIQQYRQRLGGHLMEAQGALRTTLDNPAFQQLDVTARQALAAPHTERIAKLASANRALVEAAGNWDLPLRFFWRIDLSIAIATLKSFQPAIPLTAVSLAYAMVGMVLGWVLWEFLKAVFVPAVRVRRAQAGLSGRR